MGPARFDSIGGCLISALLPPWPIVIPPEACAAPETYGADGDDAPRVIFFHGRGLGPETVSQVKTAFPTACVIAPRGGISLRRGHTWFLNKSIGVPKPESIVAATTRFLEWFDSQEPGRRPVWLCGFSNGGSFAVSLLLKFPDRFRGAALLSAPLVLPPWPTGGLTGKSIFYAHGRAQDTVVSSELFDTAIGYLDSRSGAELTLKAYDMGHEVTDREVADLATWFAAVSGRPEPA